VGVKLTELCYIIASGTGQGRSLLPNNSPPFGLPVPLISSAVEAVDVSKKKLTPLQRARLEHLAQVGSFFLSEDIKATLEEDARSASTAATRAPASERVQLALTHLSPETLHLPGKALVERVNDWLKKKQTEGRKLRSNYEGLWPVALPWALATRYALGSAAQEISPGASQGIPRREASIILSAG